MGIFSMNLSLCQPRVKQDQLSIGCETSYGCTRKALLPTGGTDSNKQGAGRGRHSAAASPHEPDSQALLTTRQISLGSSGCKCSCLRLEYLMQPKKSAERIDFCLFFWFNQCTNKNYCYSHSLMRGVEAHVTSNETFLLNQPSHPSTLRNTPITFYFLLLFLNL